MFATGFVVGVIAACAVISVVVWMIGSPIHKPRKRRPLAYPTEAAQYE